MYHPIDANLTQYSFIWGGVLLFEYKPIYNAPPGAIGPSFIRKIVVLGINPALKQDQGRRDNSRKIK